MGGIASRIGILGHVMVLKLCLGWGIRRQHLPGERQVYAYYKQGRVYSNWVWLNKANNIS